MLVQQPREAAGLFDTEHQIIEVLVKLPAMQPPWGGRWEDEEEKIKMRKKRTRAALGLCTATQHYMCIRQGPSVNLVVVS